MFYLKKAWIRILASLIVAALLLEIVAVSATDPNYRHSPRPGSVTLFIIAAVCYLLLTAYVKRKWSNEKGKL